MIKIPSGEQMKALDAATIAHEPISSWALMERAATAVVYEITARWDNRRIVIFAGPGNNGGDALAVARLLIDRGIHPETYLFNVNNRLSDDCKENRERLLAMPDASFQEIITDFQPPVLDERTLIIDGLFGTGLKQSLTGGFASLVRLINAAPSEVISIDMPSGLMCEDNSSVPHEHIVCADLTLTFQLPKLSQLFADNQPFVGELKVIDIRLLPEAIQELQPLATMLLADDLRGRLRKRPAFGHKGTFGHACLMAGSSGMAGAAILAARACLRSGVGKLTLHTPACNVSILQSAVPEAVLSIDVNHSASSIAPDTKSFQAIGVGPGLSTTASAATAFEQIIRNAKAPLVVDADGVNLLACHSDWLRLLPASSIITPHPLELHRLTGCATDGFSTLMAAKQLAAKHALYVVLKGHYTAIISPDGTLIFNATGNSGMATAGSGDVLTGILLALLAQGYSPHDTCVLGVCLHGLAGDIAAERLCEDSLIASDIIDALPSAFAATRALASSNVTRHLSM